MRIERIEASRRVKDRVLVFLQDGSLLRVTTQEVVTFSLRPGKELEAETLSRLQEAAGISHAKAAAASIIGRRAMSRRTLEKKLTEKGATEAEARYAGQWLEAIGALDDAAYAAALARHCGQKGYGYRRTRQVLREKGVPEDLWEQALEELPESEAAIDGFLKKKLQGRRPDAREKRRLSDALARRGFSWGEVRAAWSRYESGEA